ncbi:MAG: hypothetical protein ACI4J1_01675 [Ruminiclostridium sp.]
MREKIIRFMQGRYGSDKLSNFMLIVAFILIFVSMFLGINGFFLSGLGLALVVLTYVRMFSRNVQKRYAENQAFLKVYNKVKGFFTRQIGYMKQRRTHHIYSCPNCKQKLRVPKGKGNIMITCSKCHTQFKKRS